MITEEELNKLLDSGNTVEDEEKIDIYSEDYINSFNCIMFTDGSCIGKRQGTKFGGSGIYLHSANKSEYYSKWNSYKIFEKPPQEEILIKSIKSNKILFMGNKESTEIYTCGEDDCTSIGYSVYNNKLYCSRHKKEEGESVHTYEQFQPTNIRAEGTAILTALKTILYMNSKKECSAKKVKKWLIDESIYEKLKEIKMMDMDCMKVEVCVEEESKNKYMIVSDSKFWIDLITKWLPGWLSKRTFMDKKNSDIIVKMATILNMIREADCHVKFLHINGHQDKKDKSEINFYHKGNILADKLATHASKVKDSGMTVLT